MLDVLRSTTTTPGELCVMTVLTTEMQTSPAICSDLGTVCILCFTFVMLLTCCELKHLTECLSIAQLSSDNYLAEADATILSSFSALASAVFIEFATI